MADRKDLPPPTAANFLGRVREEMMRMMGKQGERIDQVVTVRDLVTAGLAKLKPSGGFEASPDLGGSSAPEQDLTPPPTPSGFALASAISHVLIEHDAPTYTQGGGHGRTRVYGVTYTTGPLPTFNDAVELGQFSGTVWAMPSNPATTWRLWIKWETADGVVSTVPAGGTNGLAVTTGQDVSTMVQAMTGPGNPFTILTAPTNIGGVLYPAGTYSVQSFIIDGQITNAKIANLAVDNAKIASVSVDKLTAGSLAVGQHIQSTNYIAGSVGWRINADGTAEFSNVTVRGTIHAGTTILGGSSTAYGAGVGFFGGIVSSTYLWRVGNPTGARIQWTGSAVEVYNSSNQLTFASGGITAAQVSGLGSLATQNSVSYAAITGTKPPADADKTSQNTAAGIANQGAFATLNQLNSSNISTYMANAAIGAAQIGSIALVGTGNFSVKSGTAGARMEMDSRAIKVFDANGVLRVQLGDLTV